MEIQIKIRRYLCETVSHIHPTRSEKNVIILMYHGIADPPIRDWGPTKYDITKTVFRDQLEQLLNQFTPISMDELAKWFEGETEIPDNSFIVTFDDALQNQFENAVPVLESLNVPATVYVPTAAITSASSLFERTLVKNIEALDIEDSAGLYQELYDVLHHKSRETRIEFVERRSSTDRQPTVHMSENQLQELDEHPLISLGSHSHAHTLLTEHADADLREDIQSSKNKLEQMIQSEVSHFSYPFGNFNTDVRRSVASNGFKTAVTTRPRVIKYQQCENQFTIPRVDGATQFNEWFGNGN